MVQSLFSMEFLHQCLLAMGTLGEGERLDGPSQASARAHFQSDFRNVWADHGDLLSVQYAGTGALKNDFTRTGIEIGCIIDKS